VDQNKRLKKERSKRGKVRGQSPLTPLSLSLFSSLLSCFGCPHSGDDFRLRRRVSEAPEKQKRPQLVRHALRPSLLCTFLTAALKNGAERGKGRLWTLKLPRGQLRVAGHFRDGVSVQRPLQAWHFLPVVRGLSPELSCPVKAPFFLSRFSPVVPVFLLHTTWNVLSIVFASKCLSLCAAPLLSRSSLYTQN